MTASKDGTSDYAADEADAVQVADFLGKKRVVKPSGVSPTERGTADAGLATCNYLRESGL